MGAVEISIISKDNNFILEDLEQYSIKKYNKFDDVIKENINIVLIDSSMDKNETIKFIKYINNNDNLSEISIIVILEGKFIQEYKDLKINDYIYKPINTQELSRRIENQLDVIKLKKRLREKELKFNVLLNNIPYMTWMKDTLSNYQTVNNEFIEHSGKDIEDIRGNGDAYVWDGKIGDKCREYDLEVMNKRKRISFNEIIPGQKGYKEFNVHKAPIIDELNNVLGTIGIARDITEVKNIDAQFKILIENIPFRVWLNDRDGNYINANSKFAESIDSEVENIIGKNMRDFYGEAQILEIIEEDKVVMAKKKPIKFEKIIKENCKERIVEVYKTPVFNIAKEVVGIVGTLVDVTDVKEVQNKIKKQANTDILTKIPNRRALYE
ncbi:MAG: PAS domain-containing protein, partial [Peptostreptococcaceae bacterium]